MLLIPIWAAPGTRAISDPFCTFIAFEVQQGPSNWGVLFWFQKPFPQREALADAWKHFILVTFYSLMSKVCPSISCQQAGEIGHLPSRHWALVKALPQGAKASVSEHPASGLGCGYVFMSDLTLDQDRAEAVAWRPFYLGSSSWSHLQKSPPFLPLSALNYKKMGSDEMFCRLSRSILLQLQEVTLTLAKHICLIIPSLVMKNIILTILKPGCTSGSPRVEVGRGEILFLIKILLKYEFTFMWKTIYQSTFSQSGHPHVTN